MCHRRGLSLRPWRSTLPAYRSQIAQVMQDVQKSGSPEALRALVEGDDIKPPLEPQRTLGSGK
jgi:hypothetical protein